MLLIQINSIVKDVQQLCNTKLLAMSRLFLFLLLISGFALKAQQTQVVFGNITDEASKVPLVGAAVVLIGNNSIGATTDEYGNFRLMNVPIGRQAFKVSYIGYEDRVIPDVIVTAGKEVALNLSLQEGVNKLDEVTITYDRSADPDKTNNDMAMVSSRSFNIDDTKKYAGAIGDPSRMAANFAGVVSGNSSSTNPC